MHSKDEHLIRKFPWMTILKRSGVLLLYAVVSTIIFYSVEECLHDVNIKQIFNFDTTYDMNNCLLAIIKTHGEKINKTIETMRNATFEEQVLECRQNVLSDANAKDDRCSFTWTQVMRWGYHVAISLFAIGKTTKHLAGTWSQIFNIFFTFFGVILTVRVYMWVGFVGVNLANFFLKRAKERVHYKWIPRQKYQIVTLIFIMLILYATLCGAITSSFSNEEFSFKAVYTWIMIFFTISDETLLTHAYKDKPIYLSIPIILVFIGFIFTSTLFAALINVQYRLTYTLKRVIVKTKKGKMQGCLV